MIKLLLLLAFLQVPSEPEEKGPDRLKHERTNFYQKDGKTLCGRLVQYGEGKWKVYVKDGMTVPRFDTRPEAAKWLKSYCPVEGQKGFKK